jgi:hypothetical protein
LSTSGSFEKRGGIALMIDYSEIRVNLAPMRSPTKFLLIAISTFLTQGLLAQEIVNKGDAIIHVRIFSSEIYGKTLIDVYKLSGEAKIIYARQDSIQFTKARKDTAYLSLSRNLNYSDQKQMAKLTNIFERYSVYDTTTVTISLKKDTAYRKILQSMTQTSKDELEASKVGKQIILDGFGFGCTIITDAGTKIIGVHTPTEESHPIIAEFLKETNDRVRSKRLRNR